MIASGSMFLTVAVGRSRAPHPTASGLLYNHGLIAGHTARSSLFRLPRRTAINMVRERVDCPHRRGALVVRMLSLIVGIFDSGSAILPVKQQQVRGGQQYHRHYRHD